MGKAYMPTTTTTSRCVQEHSTVNIDSLPPELLIHIFGFTAAIDLLSPLNIALVCRKWNDVITTSPSVYQYIHLSDSLPFNKTTLTETEISTQRAKFWKRNLTLAKLWVERANPLPFDVDIRIGPQVKEEKDRVDLVRDDSNLLGMLSPFYENMERWRLLVVNDGERPAESFKFNQLLTTRSKRMSTLCSLNISICDLSNEDSLLHVPKGLFIPSTSVLTLPPSLLGHDQVFPSPLTPFISQINRKQDREKDGRLTANFVLPTLPFLPTASEYHITHPVQPSGLPSITSLTLTEYSVTRHLNPYVLLSFLNTTPNLQKLTFVGWSHADRHPPASRLPVARLPMLNTLQLRSTCLARSILSCLYVPRLQYLELAHLNLDFELPLPGVEDIASGLVEEVYEDGDSDDEANDFSQSPWSDRSTGMGLRALMKRSNPPLKVLYMDFTDMRTKDFVWLFPKLQELEEFVIVASDMSDTVMKLLEPCHEKAGPASSFMDSNNGRDNEAGRADPQSSTIMTSRLMLPRLKKLELYNCNRLSGGTMVDVLLKRVRYTDRLSRITLPITPPASPASSSLETSFIVENAYESLAPLSPAVANVAQVYTLESLAIVGCDGFWHRHSQLLSNELGNEERNMRLEA
ncbi:hypothetical protein E1B28_012459 [Marasmius oreades]|uniref:F-box domain-containing protein n=1 Tax=Marasmius oreades TaxID=181124 RepID=A0A9P7RRP9_9AGAR|nr:uncharacterized protein E1B28_012459 [Marasmius oreades]KAG7088470.1 hypothetical protein E1B28_012459 [Marasmius oreades]